MKKISIALLALGIAFCSSVYAQSTTTTASFTSLDKIVAIVNREPITLSQLNKEIERYKQHLAQAQQPLPSTTTIRKEMLENLIGKSLQMQMCQAKGIKVEDTELNQAIDRIAKANNFSLIQLKEALQQTGLTFEEYQAQMKDQLLLQKLQQQEVAKNVSLMPEDVAKFMRENKDKFNQYNAFHLIDLALPANENAAKEQVEKVKKQAIQLAKDLQGREVDDVLKNYPTAEKNDFGWRTMAEVPSLFQAKVASMKINSLSGPIQAPNGFHILKLIEAKGENVKPTEVQIKNVVFQQKMAEATKEWVQTLRKEAYIEIPHS